MESNEGETVANEREEEHEGNEEATEEQSVAEEKSDGACLQFFNYTDVEWESLSIEELLADYAKKQRSLEQQAIERIRDIERTRSELLATLRQQQSAERGCAVLLSQEIEDITNSIHSFFSFFSAPIPITGEESHQVEEE